MSATARDSAQLGLAFIRFGLWLGLRRLPFALLVPGRDTSLPPRRASGVAYACRILATAVGQIDTAGQAKEAT
jgi:hypothetical protein